MSMTFHDFAQGSAEWHQHRATHFNASDAPAMMGCSPYMTRTELLTRLKTGISAEVDAATQRRFDDGHRFEALARPLAEKIIGQELYPVTGSLDELSASFDGLTDGIDGPYIALEHKTLNDDLRRVFDDIATIAPEYRDEAGGKVLPTMYRLQMEQQMLVSGAERVLFMASKWNGDELVEERHCWYTSDAELRAKLIAGWQQFAQDLAGFVPTAAELPKPTGRAPEALPALRVEVTGMVTASNLAEFKAQAMAVFGGISRDLKTDEDFANAEATVKWAKGIEDKVAAAKDAALSQTESIDALFKTMDEISAEARRVRLDLDKLVKARKEAIKGEIVAEGVAAFAAHIRSLNAAMPANYMPQIPADFGGCIKGLKSVDSIRNAVSTELANAKIKASAWATHIHASIGQIDAANAPMLFADMATLVLKQPDDLAAVIAQRLAAEQQRKEAERERIRAEEAARLEREAADRLEREAKAESDRVERERANAAQVEADRIAREQAEAASAARIRDELIAISSNPLPPDQIINDAAERSIGSLAAAAEKAIESAIKTGTGAFKVIGVDMASQPDIGTPADDGARMTLGEINARIAPVSITVAGLSALGYEPVAVEKAARLYPASKFPAICAAISAHVLAAPVKALEAA